MTSPQDAPERERETFTRPNGKTYRPRKAGLVGHSWENDWGTEDYGVVVLGSLDPGGTRVFAEETCRRWHNGDEEMYDPRPGWWRLAMRDGERQWVDDPVRGAPGVMWTAAIPDRPAHLSTSREVF